MNLELGLGRVWIDAEGLWIEVSYGSAVSRVGMLCDFDVVELGVPFVGGLQCPSDVSGAVIRDGIGESGEVVQGYVIPEDGG